jgi:predicted 3-demethylubiquinone-9 3-methyltransferase (glyoxalase superfamily)
MSCALLSARPLPMVRHRGREAAKFYVSVFNNARIVKISRYVNEGQEIHGKPAGSVMAVELEIEGQKFVGLNGGPQFKFTEAISFQVYCERSPAAGCGTNTASPGRLFQQFFGR